MTTAAWLSAAAVCLGVANIVLVWRAARWYRHARLLDALLMDICVKAFVRDHQPSWRAWTQAMGDIEVTLTAKRWDSGESGK
jgi:hypothetical protein